MNYCLIIAKKKMILCIWLSILVQSETNIVLKNAYIILLELPMNRGCLAQHFYSMNGRIQWRHSMGPQTRNMDAEAKDDGTK